MVKEINNAKHLIGILALGVGSFYIVKNIFKKSKKNVVEKIIETPKEIIEDSKEVIEDIVETPKEIIEDSKEVIEDIVETPKEIIKKTDKEIKKVVKKTRRFVKGSPEAKEWGRKMKERRKLSKSEAGRKGGEATAKLGKHKGHKTKKGLATDQIRKSQEEHEVNYRKNKMVKKYGYIITTENRKYAPFNRKIYKTKIIAQKTKSGIIKENSLEQRKMVGFIKPSIKKLILNERQIREMKKVKEWIYT